MFKKIEFTLKMSLSIIFILITHVNKIWIYIKSISSKDTVYNSTKSNLY